MQVPIEPSLRWLQTFISREWPLALPVALAFLALPPLAVALALPRAMLVMPRTLADLEAISAAMPGWFAPATIAMALLMAIGALALMALALVPRISVREAILVALHRLPIWIALAVLTTAGLFVALVVVGTALALVGIGQAGLVFLMVAAFVIGGCFLVLMMPLVAHRHAGPIAALNEGWRIYRGSLLKLGGALCLFWLAAWVVAFAAQVGIGSIVLLSARLLGQEAAGQTVATLFSTAASALQWGAFFLFAATLYRAAAGAAPSRGI